MRPLMWLGVLGLVGAVLWLGLRPGPTPPAVPLPPRPEAHPAPAGLPSEVVPALVRAQDGSAVGSPEPSTASDPGKSPPLPVASPKGAANGAGSGSAPAAAPPALDPLALRYAGFSKDELAARAKQLEQELRVELRELGMARIESGQFVIHVPGEPAPKPPTDSKGHPAESFGLTSMSPSGTPQVQITWLPPGEYPEYYAKKAELAWLQAQ